jgi:hypothetical protein
MQGRTFFRNHLCSELVSIARLSGSRSVQVVEGNLEEIGEWSALILTQNALPLGTKVRIWGKTHKIKGVVRSCKYDRVLGYFVDIGLDPGSRWSEKWFRPEHLFALCPSMRYFTETVPKVPEKYLLPKTAHG